MKLGEVDGLSETVGIDVTEVIDDGDSDMVG